MEFICKIPTVEEMEKRWDFLVNSHEEDRVNWEKWKKTAIDNFVTGKTIPYYGFIDGIIMCEATVVIDPDAVTPHGLAGGKRAYLSAFRTDKEYENQGYFSKLYHYMINDLKEKGYEEATLGVEPDELRNKAIYEHYGFIDYIESEDDTYPNGKVVHVDYYKKRL